MSRQAPGLAVAVVGWLLAWGVHSLVPWVPLLTAAVALGFVVGQVVARRPALDAALAPGVAVASRRMLRLGIVLLGLKLSLVDIAGLGWLAILTTVLVVVLSFGGTWAIGRALGLPGNQPLLVASGFSICGVSAVGAMSGAVRAKQEEQSVPVALVTLCGTLAIAVLPALRGPLGLDDAQFGHWVGAGVHDVGQVVATAGIAGTAALSVAVVVKLTRVLLLAPMTAIAAAVERRRGSESGTRPPIVPLFIVGFLAAVLARTFLPLPDRLLATADAVQTALLAIALVAIGAGLRFAELGRTGWRAVAAGLASWVLVGGLALVAVRVS